MSVGISRDHGHGSGVARGGNSAFDEIINI